MLFLSGGNGIWYILAAWCLWWINIYNVKREIEAGLR